MGKRIKVSTENFVHSKKNVINSFDFFGYLCRRKIPVRMQLHQSAHNYCYDVWYQIINPYNKKIICELRDSRTGLTLAWYNKKINSKYNHISTKEDFVRYADLIEHYSRCTE